MRLSGPAAIHGRHSLLDYIFFTRPVLMPPVWTIALLGAHSAESALAPIPVWRWILMFLQLWCLFGAVYTLNQIFDVESDRTNRKLFFLPQRLISLDAAWRFTISLNVLGMTLAVFLGAFYSLLSVAVLILGVLYSAGSRPWKNRPLAGFLANVVAHGVVVFAMGSAFAGGTRATIWIPALPYGLAVGGVYLATAAADIFGDRLTGKTTLAVRCGVKTTMLVALALITAALVAAALGSDWYLAIPAFASLPFFVLSATAGPWRAPGSLRALGAPQTAAKVSVAALTLAAVVAYPFYLAVLVPGFLATRAFFHWRFKMTYPSLTPGD
jgi:4-hydroxybenzoate polyprenyltransferase